MSTHRGGAAGGDRWPLTAVRGHLGTRPGSKIGILAIAPETEDSMPAHCLIRGSSCDCLTPGTNGPSPVTMARMTGARTSAAESPGSTRCSSGLSPVWVCARARVTPPARSPRQSHRGQFRCRPGTSRALVQAPRHDDPWKRPDGTPGDIIREARKYGARPGHAKKPSTPLVPAPSARTRTRSGRSTRQNYGPGA